MNYFFFSIYPYIVATVFVLGCILRYNYNQYGWTAKSSQLLDKQHFRFASNLFHISIICIVISHVMGLLTPPWLYEYFISHATKQLFAIFVGGSFGVICFVSMMFIVIRRLFNPRILLTSSVMDIVILLLLFVTLILGIVTLPFSFQHRNGENLAALSAWVQHIGSFQSGSAALMEGKGHVFKAHMIFGMTVFLIFPFSRLVHILSFPIGYLFRSYTQIVRRNTKHNK